MAKGRQRKKELPAMNWVRFCARGSGTDRLVGLCMQANIPLRQVSGNDGTLTAWVPAGKYKGMRATFHRCGATARVIQRNGPWFLLRRLRGRYGLIMGVVVFCWLLTFLQKFLWCVACPGISTGQAQQLRDALESHGLYVGAYVRQEELSAVARSLMEEDDYAWVALNFAGGRLVAECTLRHTMPETASNEATSLVAAVDALVLETQVDGGFPAHKAGQWVSAGDVLIDGSKKADRSEEILHQAPAGKVIGQVKQSYRSVQPRTLTADVLTGEVREADAILFAGHLYQPEDAGMPPKFLLVKTQIEPVTLLGFALPMSLCSRLYAAHGMQTFYRGEEELCRLAEYTCRQQLYAAFPDAEIERQSEQKDWTETALVYTWEVQFRANIAVASKN